MHRVKDQLGRTLEISKNPQRVVSLVPSITEYLYALGLENQVIGITKFCIYPEQWFQQKARIGGTKTPDIDKIRALKPDLIIGNKEENRSEDVADLEEIAPVWMSDVNSIEEMYTMLMAIAQMLGKEKEGRVILDQWKKYFQNNKNKGLGQKALYFIWKEPEMVVGTDTYIDAYMRAIGYVNVVQKARYPLLSDLQDLNPSVVLLSTEPFPFKEADFGYFKERFPKARIELVSGEEFSWYGVRNVI